MTLSIRKTWLLIWLVVSLVLMYIGLDTNTYKIFSYEKFFGNVFLFAPACSILFFSVVFQWLNICFKNMVLSGMVATICHFCILAVFLPYEFLACVLLGVIATPIGMFHYSIFAHFLGMVYEE